MFDFKYPSTNNNVLNLDWILGEIKRLDTDLSTLEDRVKEAAINAAKEYVDAEMTDIRSQMTSLNSKVNSLSAEVDKFEDDVRNYLEARLTFISKEISDLDKKINASVIGVNARTDLAIEQNNEYLLSQITDKLLPSMRVVNMFTGEKVTIQNMFNYLGSLHTDDGATINYVVSQDKTVNEIIAIDASCTDWVLHGRTLLA